MVRPLIAIDGFLAEGDTPKVSLATGYVDAVRRAGGLPLVVAPLEAAELGELFDRVDGVLLSGGDDFDTERLGLGPIHPAATPTPGAKQDFDFDLARGAIARRVPVLGICYGMQVLGLAEGGGLIPHLPEDRPGSREHADGVEHPVRILAGTKLARLMGVEGVSVVSRHHQAISSVAGDWAVCATDDEGLIEAIESQNHPFALGVQWHPELSAAESPHARLFEGLVEAARHRGLARTVGVAAP